MATRIGVDKWLFGITLTLVLWGLAMVFSASAVMATERYGSPYTFLLKQSLWALLGLITMTGLMRVDYNRYNHAFVAYTLVGLTTLLLMVVFLMPGSHATHRWIRFGGFFSLQPSEVAKPVLVLFLAWFLQNRMSQMKNWRRTLLPAALPGFVFVLLIVAEPDLGTAVVCFAVMGLMLFLAGIQWRYLIGAVLAGAVPLAALLMLVPWRRARIMAFLHPDAAVQGVGFQTNQSLIAVGTGGLNGLGYMEGVQKLFYLPEPHTDFIFATVAEEFGFLRTILMVLLFVLLGYRGLRAAALVRDPFGRFLAFGITATILIQSFFNLSVVMGVLPNKGIPLPLISSGGTSLFITLASIGVLLNVTREIDGN
jgi:cell division protein FtsW